MKKRFLLCLILIILILVILFVLYKKQSNYSLDEVIELINQSNLPSNVYIENDIFSNDFDEPSGYAKYYIKDNISYIYQENDSLDIIETIRNLESSEEITINHKDKTIISSSTVNNIELPMKETFLLSAEQVIQYDGTYKYYGKEDVNGKECIKVSLMQSFSNDDSTIYMDYYYIDLETNYIVKYEIYDGTDINTLEKSYEETYEYSTDIVTDNDILQFDIENYPDYEYSAL